MIQIRRLSADARGATLIEFALLAPILLTLLLGMLGYGQYLLTAHALQQVANDAARAAIVGHTRLERTALAQASVTEGLSGSVISRPDKVETGFVERDGRVHVTLSVDTRDLGLLRASMVPMPDPVLQRRAVAGLAELS